MKRWLFFAYGVGCHMLFLGTYAWMVGFVGSLGVPQSIDSSTGDSPSVAGHERRGVGRPGPGATSDEALGGRVYEVFVGGVSRTDAVTRGQVALAFAHDGLDVVAKIGWSSVTAWASRGALSKAAAIRLQLCEAAADSPSTPWQNMPIMPVVPGRRTVRGMPGYDQEA